MIVLRDWAWDADYAKWSLHCRLAPDVDGTAHIPAMSNWYVLADPEYPWGTITFCPANDGGLVATFQHQHHNGTGPGDRPWRAGDICLDTTVRVLDRAGDDDEPYTAHERLRWRFRRALDWLDAAARGILTLPGEPFELPEFPTVAGARTVAYAEGRDSYAVWDALPDRAGNVDLVRVREGIYAVARFHGTGGRSVFEPHWGSALSPEVDGATRGIWLRLDAVPVLAPWQAPSTWGELRAVAREQGCDIDTLLRANIRTLRDDQEHIALLGFPIPERVGETPTQLHWQALLLPPLTPARGSATYPGFRPNEDGKWMRDRMTILTNERSLTWLVAENWHPDQLASRGRLPVNVTTGSVLIIGTGALGSALAEMLVRAGWYHALLLDGDRLQAGNLVRHTLGLRELGEYKASAVAARLNLASPHATIEALDANFPPRDGSTWEQIRRCRVVIDTTGSDAVLQSLAVFPWEGSKLFFSVSLGIEARRLYCFTAMGECFPHAIFRGEIGPWLLRDREEREAPELPREGIGCWHPVFPARADDIWLFASLAAKHLTERITARQIRPTLAVFERFNERGMLAGVRKIDGPGARD